jgi:surface antigen
MKIRIIAFLLVATLGLSACAENSGGNPWGMGNKQTVGTGAGALIGGILGSRVGGGSGRLWATGAGALLGALAGSEVGKSLDRADMQYNQQAMDRAYTAPLNQTIAWNNPESGHSGAVTPIREGHTAQGNVCREYQQKIIVDGKTQTGVGRACQESDGSWTIKN